jgi:hypothetical protein
MGIKIGDVSEFLVGVGIPTSPAVVAPIMAYAIMLTPLKHKYKQLALLVIQWLCTHPYQLIARATLLKNQE